MTFTPELPESAPFSDEQRAWMNGYFASMFGDGSDAAPDGGVAQATTESLAFPVAYGTQTGNSEYCARQLCKAAEDRGWDPEMTDLSDMTPADLEDEEILLLITSTYGEGDMPDNAEAFWQALKSDDAPSLDHLSFSVLALGDSAYVDTFCEAGKKVDARLEELGAERICERVDCDVEYEEPFEEWRDDVFDALEDLAPDADTNGAVPSAMPSSNGSQNGDPVEAGEELRDPVDLDGPTYDRETPFPANMMTNKKLNADVSDKDTRHIELSLRGSDIVYEPGDTLAVKPVNDRDLVENLLDTLDFSGVEPVRLPNNDLVPLRKALTYHYEIANVSRGVTNTIASVAGEEDFMSILNGHAPDSLGDYLAGRDVVDVFDDSPDLDGFTPEQLIDALSPLKPRLYSIASSHRCNPGEVHLTVAVVEYEHMDREHKGVCSTFLANRADGNQHVPVWLQKNPKFGLPEDNEAPIIMVGPGTGIAPFRAFLQDRRARGVSGRNWLFFGDRRREQDFLYEDELKNFDKNGVLDRMSTAFSRDGDEKTYVQHRMEENAEALWSWLDKEGAHFYVCGDASRMADDVDETLHEICQDVGDLDREQTEEWVQNLRDSGRYQRDVY